MKFIVTLLLTALLSYAACLYFQWYSIVAVAFIIALCIYQQPWKAFLAAFLALFLLWGITAYNIDRQNGHLLAAKIAAILPLGGSAAALIVVTAAIGALAGGMGALTGSLLRRIF